MESRVHKEPVLPADSIEPGNYFLARVGADRFAMVMVVTADLLPQKQRDGEAKAKELFRWKTIYPCWVMGRGWFVWLARTRLFYLHTTQADLFSDSEDRKLFNKYYNLSRGTAKGNGISYFSLEILMDSESLDARDLPPSPTRRRSQSPGQVDNAMFFSDRDSPKSHGRPGLTDTSERSKRTRQDEESPIGSGGDGPPTPAPSDDRTNERQEVKTEDEETMFNDMNKLPKSDLVAIYVGRSSQEHEIPTVDLPKSPVLASWVNKDSGHPFIMHPSLRTISNQQFASIIRFMHTGEYLPNIVDIPTGIDTERNALSRKGLNGLRTSEQYSAELVRAGHVYLLAEKLQVTGLTDYVFKRVSETEFSKYTNEAVLRFARIIFSRPGATTGAGSGVDAGTTIAVDKLEEWILGWLSFEFQSITRHHCDLFYDVAGHTVRSHFFQRLLRAKADQVDSVGGEPDHLDD